MIVLSKYHKKLGAPLLYHTIHMLCHDSIGIKLLLTTILRRPDLGCHIRSFETTDPDEDQYQLDTPSPTQDAFFQLPRGPCGDDFHDYFASNMTIIKDHIDVLLGSHFPPHVKWAWLGCMFDLHPRADAALALLLCLAKDVTKIK
jgi:hypothetical protein